MPNQPKTPARTVRIADDLWGALQRQAAKRKITVSDLIREVLHAYVQKDSK